MYSFIIYNLASFKAIRLDDIKELIKFFQNKYDTHTASSLSLIKIPNKLLRQDIVTAQNTTWFSTESLNSVNKSLWCSTAIALYSQIKNANNDFLTNNIDNPFIQAFINYQLPRHTHWQDSSVSAYCEKMIVIDTQISLIKQFIAHEAFKNTSITAYLKKIIKTRPNIALHLSKIAATCEKALTIYRELSLIDNVTDCREIKDLIMLKKLALLNTFCVETFSTNVEKNIDSLTQKLKGYQNFQADLNNISLLKTHNPQCFMVMQNALRSSLNTFTNTEDAFLTFPSKVENLLSTLALITNGFVILDDFKNQYGLQDKIFFDYVMSLINALKILNLQSNLDTINERMKTLQTIADSLSTIINFKSNSYIATPAFISWVDSQLSKIFAENLIPTGERLERCANQLSKYTQLDKSASDIDKKAFTLLNQYTQFVFKTNNLIDINNALIALNKCKLRLIKFTIDLMRLKKLLTYAGYLDAISSLFEQALVRCTENTDDGLSSIEDVLNIAKNITQLFSEQDTYRSERQQQVYDIIVNYVVKNKRCVNLNLYRKLQEQIAISPDIEINQTVFESIIEECTSEELQPTINSINLPASTSVSMISIFNSRYLDSSKSILSILDNNDMEGRMHNVRLS